MTGAAPSPDAAPGAARRAPAAELRPLALALLASLVLWNVPYGGVLLYPFKLLATWLHELSHGLVMTVTGAGFDGMYVYRDTSGLAHAARASAPLPAALIAAAGYMGTPAWGATLLVVARDGRAARRALLALAGLLVFSALAVLGNDFGFWAVLAMGAVVAIVAVALPPRGAAWVSHFVAAQACVDALLDVRVLLRPTLVVDGKVVGASDAHAMARATFGTTDRWAVSTWAVAWLAWSLLALFVALRIDRRRRAGG